MRTVPNKRKNGRGNGLKMKVNEVFNSSGFAVAAGHYGSAWWKNVRNGPFVISFVYFWKSVKVSGTRIDRRREKTVLTFRDEALIKHVVDSMFDESSSL